MLRIHEGQPFHVSVRRTGGDGSAIALQFKCLEGQGVLGIRAPGRTDPKPSAIYRESDIDPDGLKVGRFIHVLPNGQRQSYALSRIGREIAATLPSDAWVTLEPLVEYGFRYLVVPEGAATAPTPGAEPPDTEEVEAAAAVAAGASPPSAAAEAVGAIPRQTPMSPTLAREALASLDRDAAVRHLEGEMAKVATLQGEVDRLRGELEASAQRERDLLDLLRKWREG